MKISETSGDMFAIVDGIECRLTTRSRVKNKREILDRRWVYAIDEHGIYRAMSSNWFPARAIMIPQYLEKVENKMRKLWYIDFDYDSKEYALVKCYK